MINVGLLGLGTVGTGVVEILEERKAEILRLLADDITIKKILVKDLHKKRDLDLRMNMLTQDFEDILNDPEISIIIEVTGDMEQSYQYIKQALNQGKSVVTANKALVARHFEELSGLAAEKGVSFLYEASVAGGIPILKPIKEEIILNKISEVQGILNGTCNYILTKMFDEDLDYDEALKKAQDLGYAEADPTADVEGHDTLRKLRILGTICLQGKIEEKDIILEGIERITAFDVKQIKQMHSTVKLIGEVIDSSEGYTAVVLPTLVKMGSYFDQVNLAYNAVSFKGNHIGELKFYGAGAGKLATADAVLRDVLDISLGYNRKHDPLGTRGLKNNNAKFRSTYYLRISEMKEKNLKLMEGMLDKVVFTKGNVVILTEKMELKRMMTIISSLDLKKEDYFLARILEERG